MHEPFKIIYKRCSGSYVPRKYFSSVRLGYEKPVGLGGGGSYTVTAGYIFCSPPVCGNGDWICL